MGWFDDGGRRRVCVGWWGGLRSVSMAARRCLLDGSLDLGELEGLGDDEARGRLMELKGIGRWSADIYLLMALRRPDVWPRSDLALISAIKRIKRLIAPPSPEEFDAIGEAWRPWRSAAARIAWFEYLGGKP